MCLCSAERQGIAVPHLFASAVYVSTSPIVIVLPSISVGLLDTLYVLGLGGCYLFAFLVAFPRLCILLWIRCGRVILFATLFRAPLTTPGCLSPLLFFATRHPSLPRVTSFLLGVVWGAGRCGTKKKKAARVGDLLWLYRVAEIISTL